MQNPRLASRYAKSLLDLAIEQNNLEATLKDVQLLESTSKNRDFANMLRSPIIKADKKNEILKAILGSRMSPLTQAFLNLLVSKGRETNLPEIASAFISQYKTLKNIQTVKLTTATPASDALKSVIRNKVVGMMPNAQIELKEEVDPAIIGGFVLQMGDKLVDASVLRDLKDVRAQFTKNIYVSQISSN